MGSSGTGSATAPARLAALAAAVEGGAGLPALARAAAEGLGGSVAVIDRAGAVLAVADASAGQERELLSGGDRVESLELRVGEAVVGEMRVRSPDGEVDGSAAALVSAVLALAVERARSPDWASDRLAGDYVRAVLDREVTDRGDIVARGAELGCELEKGAGVVALRAQPRGPQEGEWRERVLNLTLRALRGVSAGSLAALRDDEHAAHSHGGEAAFGAALVPGDDDGVLGRSAEAVERELSTSLSGFTVTVGRSRLTNDPADLYRAGKEALLAMNVGAAEGIATLAFEDTGSYRLLLPAMSEDPGELERFYAETVAPLAAYDEQYETDLVTTVETYLDEDGSVTPTAERLFTHRHTVRYRLERVKEVTGLDLTSTEGREKVGLGLKAMRVLGIAPPRGPANEPGSEAGKVSRGKQS
ncbi:MAG TPA: helix-turn-helix domain-containing protein [Solirubrobacterales bacterium]